MAPIMALGLHKKRECRVEKLKNKKLEHLEVTKQKISQISLHEVLQWWLINTVYNLLVNGGEAGLKRAY